MKGEYQYQKALTALQNGNWLQAFQILLGLVEHFPQFMPAYRELALISWDTGHYDFARQVLEEALKHEPLDQECNFLLGNILYMEGAYREALHHYARARGKGEGSPELAYNMGLCYRQTGNLDKAISYFRLAFNLAPDMVEALLALGSCNLELGDLEEAEELLWKALELDPSSAEAYHLLGTAQAQREKWEEALVLWEEAIALEPNRPETLRQMGWAHHMMGEKELAIEYLEASIRLYPEFIQARFDISLIYMQDLRIKEAMEHLKAILDVEPQNPLALRYLEEVRRIEEYMEREQEA